ncbi:MAG: macro domain-containing protein, partial [Oligoflexia bacterium]|nr:macro domain-containing protein [Oligoflexia bacterium]
MRKNRVLLGMIFITSIVSLSASAGQKKSEPKFNINKGLSFMSDLIHGSQKKCPPVKEKEESGKQQQPPEIEISLRFQGDLTQWTPPIKAAGMFPRGSAVYTSSGNLKDKNISGIIHAASGSHSMVEGAHPTLSSIAESVQNSLKLAKLHKHKKVAIPLIGGGIFLNYIFEATNLSPAQKQKQLVQTLVRAVITENAKEENPIPVVFVAYEPEVAQLFQVVIAEEFKGGQQQKIESKRGSITE